MSVSGKINIINNETLDKFFINIGETQLQNIRNHFTKFYDILKLNPSAISNENTKVVFDISMWMPHKERTNSTDSDSWSLPEDYFGENDPRITQIPVEYSDPLTSKTKVYQYLDSAGEPGYRYNNRTIGLNQYSAKKLILNYFTTLTNGGSNSFADISNVQNVGIYDSDNYDIELNIDDTFPVLLTQIGKSAFGASKQKFIPSNMDYSGNYNYDNSGSMVFGVYRNGTSTYLNFGNGISGNTDGFVFIDKNGIQYRTKIEDGKHTLIYKVRKNSDNNHDVYIFLDGAIIHEIKNGGTNLNEINYIGTNDPSLNAVGQRPNTTIKFYDLSNNISDISLNSLIKTDINSITDVSYANISSDNSFNPITDIEVMLEPSIIGLNVFPESTNFIKNFKRIPYIGKFDYNIINQYTLTNISSRIDYIDKSNNFKTRLGNWATITDSSGNETFDIQNETPCSAVYKYGAFFIDIITDYSNNTIYPEQLDLSYNNSTNNLTVSIPKLQILNLMYGFLYRWLGDTLITNISYNIYAWRPETTKLTYYTIYSSSNNLIDLSNANIATNNASDLEYSFTPDNIAEIFNPGLPNRYAPENNRIVLNNVLIPGKWLFAWTYKVNNNLYVNESPNYIEYDVSFNKIVINNSDYLYEPNAPNIIYSSDISSIVVSITESEKSDFIAFLNLVDSTFSDLFISSVKIYYYLWTPNKEITFDLSGWKLPENYTGDTDVRLYNAPVQFYNSNTNLMDITDISNNILGFDISKSIVKQHTINAPINTIQTIPDMSYSLLDVSATSMPDIIDYSNNNLGIPYITRWGYKINLSNNTISNSDISNNQYQTLDDSGNTFTIGENYYRTNNWLINVDASGNKSFKNQIFNKYNYSTLFLNEIIEPEPILIDDTIICDTCVEKRGITKSTESLTKNQRYSSVIQNFKYGPRIGSTFNCSK